MLIYIWDNIFSVNITFFKYNIWKSVSEGGSEQLHFLKLNYINDLCTDKCTILIEATF